MFPLSVAVGSKVYRDPQGAPTKRRNDASNNYYWVTIISLDLALRSKLQQVTGILEWGFRIPMSYEQYTPPKFNIDPIKRTLFQDNFPFLGWSVFFKGERFQNFTGGKLAKLRHQGPHRALFPQRF